MAIEDSSGEDDCEKKIDNPDEDVFNFLVENDDRDIGKIEIEYLDFYKDVVMQQWMYYWKTCNETNQEKYISRGKQNRRKKRNGTENRSKEQKVEEKKEIVQTKRRGTKNWREFH